MLAMLIIMVSIQNKAYQSRPFAKRIGYFRFHQETGNEKNPNNPVNPVYILL